MGEVIKKASLLEEGVEVGMVSKRKGESKLSSDQPFGELDFSGNLKHYFTTTLDGFQDRIAGLIRRLERSGEHYRSVVETTSSKSYERGRIEGVKNEGVEILGRLQSFVEDVKSKRDQFFQSIEADVVELAVRIAGKIVASKVEIDKEVTAGVIRQCLENIGRHESILVRVSPEDYDEIVKHQPEWIGMIENIESFDIKADPAVSRGGCVVETASGFVDGQIESQLETFSRKLSEDSHTP